MEQRPLRAAFSARSAARSVPCALRLWRVFPRRDAVSSSLSAKAAQDSHRLYLARLAPSCCAALCRGTLHALRCRALRGLLLSKRPGGRGESPHHASRRRLAQYLAALATGGGTAHLRGRHRRPRRSRRSYARHGASRARASPCARADVRHRLLRDDGASRGRLYDRRCMARRRAGGHQGSAVLYGETARSLTYAPLLYARGGRTACGRCAMPAERLRDLRQFQCFRQGFGRDARGMGADPCRSPAIASALEIRRLFERGGMHRRT